MPHETIETLRRQGEQRAPRCLRVNQQRAHRFVDVGERYIRLDVGEIGAGAPRNKTLGGSVKCSRQERHGTGNDLG